MINWQDCGTEAYSALSLRNTQSGIKNETINQPVDLPRI